MRLYLFIRFLLNVAGLAIVTPILATPILILSLFPSAAYIVFKLSWLWAWFIAKFMGLTFSISGAEKLRTNESYLLTANHQSYTDILAYLLTLPVRYRWVIKRELVKIPIFGWALDRTGAISINRSDRETAIRSLDKAKERLKGGWSVLIYPEGTRTRDGHIQQFKKGAFMLAVQTGIPIVPLTCNGAYKVLPRGSLLVRPGHIKVSVSDPIYTDGLSEADVPDLMNKTREAVLARFDPTYDPFSKDRSEDD